jgi:hypothetical protein
LGSVIVYKVWTRKPTKWSREVPGVRSMVSTDTGVTFVAPISLSTPGPFLWPSAFLFGSNVSVSVPLLSLCAIISASHPEKLDPR